MNIAFQGFYSDEVISAAIFLAWKEILGIDSPQFEKECNGLGWSEFGDLEWLEKSKILRQKL